MSDATEQSAREVLDTVPLVMRTIRSEMRSQCTPGLSIPQFRALAFLNRHEGASLSDVAEHLGLTLPSISKVVDGLVTRGLVERQTCPTDRRKITLALTAPGKAMLESARLGTQVRLAKMLAPISTSDLAVVVQAMQVLRSVFTPGQKVRGGRDR